MRCHGFFYAYKLIAEESAKVDSFLIIISIKENEIMTYIEENSKIWDERSENNDTWSIPVTSEMVKFAREGVWSILLTPTKPVPENWFPEKLGEKKILCLASGGGQQGPILAATGADVIVKYN